MALALAVLLCLGCGFALAGLGWTRWPIRASDWLLRASLASGFGIGIFSLIFFFSLLLQFHHLLAADAAVFGLMSLTWLLLRRSSSARLIGGDRSSNSDSAPPRLLTLAFALALAAGLYSAVMRTLAYPHGDGWDAFAIWNLHARFLFRGSANWRDGFSALIPWSHPDYPLLLPGAIAHFWTVLGRESTAVPTAIAFLFTFSTVGVLFSTLLILRGRNAAMLGAIAVLATPSFIEQGTAQYADVPLSFFMLATIALLAIHDDRVCAAPSQRRRELLILAGIAAGFSAWTKNEGLLFLVAICAARAFFFMRRRPASSSNTQPDLVPFLLAVVPFLFLIAGFKHFLAPQSELAPDAAALHKLLDPWRYWVILKWYGKGFFRFGGWIIPMALLLVGLGLASERKKGFRQPGFSASVLALAVSLVGYFAIYLITPYDLYWHLRFSLYRLMLQLWPSAVLLFFLAIKIWSNGHTSHESASAVSK